jgi:putative transport protein
MGRRELLVERVDGQRLGVREVDDRELLDVPAEVLDVVVTRAEIDGRTLADLARDESARCVFLRRIMRAGTPVPMFPATTLHRGDVVTLVGPTRRIADAVGHIGVPDRATDVTDMVLVAFGIVGGALVGIPALRLRGIDIGLSLSVGVLLGGLVCGWLRSMWPRFFGRIPSPTLWVFESLGLAGFVAVVGLERRTRFRYGPAHERDEPRDRRDRHRAGAACDRRRRRPLGVQDAPGRDARRVRGSGTATPALAAIQEAAKSAVPTLGYGVAYAVGNVLLALWGTVIVALLYMTTRTRGARILILAIVRRVGHIFPSQIGERRFAGFFSGVGEGVP